MTADDKILRMADGSFQPLDRAPSPRPADTVLRTDAPAVRDAGNAERNCAACRFWSRWLPETGDCLHYVYRRRDAMLTTATAGDAMDAFRRGWPDKCARTTSAHETCDGWEEADAG